MEQLDYQEFAKKELERWVMIQKHGGTLPSIVTRVLETAYKNYSRDESEIERAKQDFFKKMAE